MEKNIFTKKSNFDTVSQFNKDFPMFKDTHRSIPPFILPNTVNGACVIFRTSDNSQFIYRMCNKSIELLGPSEEFVKILESEEIDFYWIMHNILNISVSQCKTQQGYEFSYEKIRYIIKIDNNDRYNLSLSII